MHRSAQRATLLKLKIFIPTTCPWLARKRLAPLGHRPALKKDKALYSTHCYIYCTYYRLAIGLRSYFLLNIIFYNHHLTSFYTPTLSTYRLALGYKALACAQQEGLLLSIIFLGSILLHLACAQSACPGPKALSLGQGPALKKEST